MNQRMPLISVICVYNDSHKLQQFFYKGLDAQTVPVELITIDNTSHQFSSAAKALNYGAQQSTGDILVFMHQDILIEDIDGWNRLLEYFKQGYRLVGVSGMRKWYPFMMSNVTTGTHDKKAMVNWICTKHSVPVKVETLDECFIAMTRDVYEKILFDEQICDNWHLYSVDFCLEAKKQGISSWVVPIQMHHQSGGHINKAFINNLIQVIKKHHIKWMAAPCYHFWAVRPCVWGLYYFWQLVYRMSSPKNTKQFTAIDMKDVT